MYKFKEIQTVPPSDGMIDIVLSKTQRKTPTVVHPGYKITRIRNFYLRKIKFCQSCFSERLTGMLTDFPRLDDIHPFYSDLCNVLYDRDHYKLALGQVSTAKNVIDNCAKDYVRMMKYADSLYRCKILKRAAMGRMCTVIKKLGATLVYLEEVRQHLARLPSINPTEKTLLLTGFPNVGKSSFMNTVTMANVDCQPYAFTTKSLYLGHMDYEYGRWQVIDTPGILDKPLEERNTIEMQAITALAHIPATVLYFVDCSETCGYNLKQQVVLFNSLKPLFRKKPVLIILNKSDLRKLEDLSEEEAALVMSMTKDLEMEDEEDEETSTATGTKTPKTGNKILLMPTSCATKAGIDDAKNKACQMLLKKRIDTKINSSKVEAMQSRIMIVQPKTDKIQNARPASIPESVLKQRKEDGWTFDSATTKNLLSDSKNPLSKGPAKRAGVSNSDDEMDTTDASSPSGPTTEKQLQEKFGGAGVYSVDLNKSYILDKPEWKYDEIPEIMDGMNVADFVDENILEKLAELEKEEREELEQEGLEDTEKVLASWRETEAEIAVMHTAIRTQQQHNADRRARNTAGQKSVDRRRVKTLQEVAKSVEESIQKTEKYVSVQELKAEQIAKGETEETSVNLRRSKKKVDAAELEANLRSRSKGTKKRLRDEIEETPRRKSLEMSRKRSASRVGSSKVAGLSLATDRRQSRTAQSLTGRPDLQEKSEMKRRKLTKQRNVEARRGEGDRYIPDWKPKHLHSGKRGMGKTDRR